MKRAPAKNSSAWGLPVQAKNFPQEIILLPRWTGWAASPRPGQINKWDKKPVVSIGGSIQGLRWTDPAQWRTFDEVYAEYVANDQISGVGFIMNQISEGVFGEDLVVFDLDNAVIDGEINPVARQVMEQFPTYWELSPSGTGLRGIIRGNIEVEVTTSRCEVYDGRSNRFVTITGHQIPGTCNAVQWAEPDALYDFIQSHRSGTASASRSRANKPMPELLPEEKASALIEELRKSCNADLIKYVDGGETVGRYDNAGSLSEVVAGFIATAYTAGFSDQQVLSMLWFHEHTQVYYKPDRANRLAFFWSECCACHFDRTATAEDFKVVATEAKSTSSVSINAKQSLLEALIPGGEFAKQLIEIDFVIEEIIQRGYIYALTGLSNAGKTAVALAMSVSIALEQPFAGHYTTKGRVLFLAGENPQNVQMRLRAMLEQNELDETVLDKILIRQNVFSLRRNMDDIRETLKELDDIVLIVIDSKLVFFESRQKSSSFSGRIKLTELT